MVWFFKPRDYPEALRAPVQCETQTPPCRLLTRAAISGRCDTSWAETSAAGVGCTPELRPPRVFAGLRASPTGGPGRTEPPARAAVWGAPVPRAATDLRRENTDSYKDRPRRHSAMTVIIRVLWCELLPRVVDSERGLLCGGVTGGRSEL